MPEPHVSKLVGDEGARSRPSTKDAKSARLGDWVAAWRTACAAADAYEEGLRRGETRSTSALRAKAVFNAPLASTPGDDSAAAEAARLISDGGGAPARGRRDERWSEAIVEMDRALLAAQEGAPLRRALKWSWPRAISIAVIAVALVLGVNYLGSSGRIDWSGRETGEFAAPGPFAGEQVAP